MKLAIFFDGTGASRQTEQFAKRTGFQLSHDTVSVYITGCHHKQVGNGYFSPDLNIGINHIISAFTDQGEINLQKLENIFQGAVVLRSNAGKNLPIAFKPESILLSGFSRGGVSTFFLAKALNKPFHLKDIPIDIVANQPVPGHNRLLPGDCVNPVIDCQDCQNIRSVTILLGSYDPSKLKFHENIFFSQMAPSFNQDTQTQYIEIPAQTHVRNADLYLSQLHVAYAIMELKHYTTEGNEQSWRAKIQRYYQYNPKYFAYTPTEKKQSVFTIEAIQLQQEPIFGTLLEQELIRHLRDDELSTVILKNEQSKQTMLLTLQRINYMLKKIADAIKGHPEKTALVEEKKNQYKTDVLRASANFLLNNCTKTYAQTLIRAENNLGRALDVDRHPTRRKLMRVLTTTIFALVTGLTGLVISALINWNAKTPWYEKISPFYAKTTSRKKASNLTAKMIQSASGKSRASAARYCFIKQRSHSSWPQHLEMTPYTRNRQHPAPQG